MKKLIIAALIVLPFYTNAQVVEMPIQIYDNLKKIEENNCLKNFGKLPIETIKTPDGYELKYNDFTIKVSEDKNTFDFKYPNKKGEMLTYNIRFINDKLFGVSEYFNLKGEFIFETYEKKKCGYYTYL